VLVLFLLLYLLDLNSVEFMLSKVRVVLCKLKARACAEL
jgi:hypothetical protein